MTHAEPRLPGVSTREAAIILGVSESDVRRRIRRGELRAESIPRPGGTLLRVLLDTPQDAPGDAPAADPTPSTGAAPDTRQGTSEAIQAAVDPLAEALAEERAERQRLSAENADLRERVGRAETRAELEAQRADDLAKELQRLRERRWWKPSTW